MIKSNMISKSKKKGFLSFYSVAICVSMYVCAFATAYTVRPRELKFGHVGEEQFFSKCIILFFKILIFFAE